MKNSSCCSGFAKRLIISKTLGFFFGLIAFFALPIFWADATLMLRLGILFWYMTLGGLVGLMGVMNHHPLWKGWKFPAWFRGIFLGSWMNFVLVFFAYDVMKMVLAEMNFGLFSPWWFVLEGAIIGLIVDVVATKYGGEGEHMF